MTGVIEDYSEVIQGFEEMDFVMRREAAIGNGMDGKVHNQTTLKEIFRVKPAANAVSDYGYKNFHGQYVKCYSLSQCVPMRAKSTKPRSEKQLESSRKLAERAVANSKENVAIALAQHLVKNAAVVIDTETTDLHGEVVQIAAVCCQTLEVLLKTYVKPVRRKITAKARAVHGISDSQLIDAPRFMVVALEMRELLDGKEWIAFNTSFDRKAMHRSCKGKDKGKGDTSWIDCNIGGCAMFDLAAPILGSNNRYGTISLKNAAAELGIEFEGDAHDAAVDALVTAKLIQAIASIER